MAKVLDCGTSYYITATENSIKKKGWQIFNLTNGCWVPTSSY